MSVIHLEGMGLLGSLTALHLERADVPFTWFDSITEHAAWPISTGLVYPAGDQLSQDGLRDWFAWIESGLIPAGCAEEVRYVYAHKHPPHDGTYANRVTDLGDMRVAPRWSAVAVNVPALVETVRGRNMHRFVPTPPPDPSWYVTAHGFNDRLWKVMWGWAARIKLDVPADLVQVCDGLRPAFYSRKDRFQIVYAYPIPGTDEWWAGSSLIGQATPRRLDAEKHYARWREAWAQLWPRVPIVAAGPARQGWRPRPRPETEANPTLVTMTVTHHGPGPSTMTYPPLWHSGVRWSPSVMRQAIPWLTA